MWGKLVHPMSHEDAVKTVLYLFKNGFFHQVTKCSINESFKPSAALHLQINQVDLFAQKTMKKNNIYEVDSVLINT